MTKVLWTTKWIWAETFEYVFDEPLPDNWNDMTNKEKEIFLSSYDCEKVDMMPLEPLAVSGYNDDTYEVYE
jgi:hypothetical protein